MCFHFRNSLPLWAIFIYNILIYLSPANEVCEGHIFTGVCPQGGVSVRETPPPCTVTCGRYASYWNAFLSQLFWVGSLWCQNWNQPYWYSSTRFISITRMHSSRMRTARSLTVSPCVVISHTCPPPLGATMHAPQSNHACPPEQPCMPPRNHRHPPLEQQCMPPPVNRMTNWCKNITLPQTSFAGGNKRENWQDVEV